MTLDFSQAREKMVEQQIRPWDVLDTRVLDVLARLPREAFVPEQHRNLAYADLELPLGNGQKMLKPVIEGRVLQAVLPQEGEEILEVGTGSGFLAACFGALAREVVSVEIDPAQADAARARLDAARLGGNVRVETGDGLQFQGERKFDAIVVTGATAQLPLQLLKLLREGGRLFAVHGESPVQQAVLVFNEVNGPRIESLFETDLPYLAGAAPTPKFVF